jgi:hypothetical protein
VDEPRALNTLKSIAAGKDVLYDETSISALEDKGLVKRGQLTMTDHLVYIVDYSEGHAAVWGRTL